MAGQDTYTPYMLQISEAFTIDLITKMVDVQTEKVAPLRVKIGSLTCLTSFGEWNDDVVTWQLNDDYRQYIEADVSGDTTTLTFYKNDNNTDIDPSTTTIEVIWDKIVFSEKYKLARKYYDIYFPST